MVVGEDAVAALAVKMSTASVYKGTAALLAQALRAADHYGVLRHVLDDLDELADDAGRRIALSGGEGGADAWRNARDRGGAAGGRT